MHALIYVLGSILLLSSSSHAAPASASSAQSAQSASAEETFREIDRLWRGRGVQALEKVKAVSKGETDFIDHLPVAKQCAYVLEAAYAYVAVDTKLKVMRRDPKAKTTIYTLFLDADKPSASSISVLYRDDEKQAYAIGTESLGPGWRLSAVRGSGYDLVLARENCTIGLKLNSPLDAEVLGPKPAAAKSAEKTAEKTTEKK